MAEIITLIDGKNETVHDMNDALSLVEKYMGFEAYRYMRDKLYDIEDELKQTRSCFQEKEELQEKADLLSERIKKHCDELDELLHWEPLEKAELEELLERMCESVRNYHGQK